MSDPREDNLGFVAGVLNGVPATAARTVRLAPVVIETNTLIRDAADMLLSLDTSPLSFQAFKASCEPRT